MPSEDWKIDSGIEFGTGSELPNLTAPSDRLSIFNMYIVLANYMSHYEKGLADTIKTLEGSTAQDIDQGTLLRLQAMVQTWGTVSGTATSIVRSVGDTLTKITQNIR
ncbi:MAG: hypothetical protein LBG09_01890 [Puniceicoccales bacterium]|jgi:hypothetical protein|nr:hypothetical protein [Puniceicoccales bacterium]